MINGVKHIYLLHVPSQEPLISSMYVYQRWGLSSTLDYTREIKFDTHKMMICDVNVNPIFQVKPWGTTWLMTGF